MLPGTKNTLSDLAWLRANGLAEWVLARHQRGATVIGICGGYQMLGTIVADPAGVESSAGHCAGLGLVSATTELTIDKTTRAVAATTPAGVRFGAYEIHHGITTLDEADSQPFATLDEGTRDGYRGSGLLGTYLHGAFENADVCTEVFGVRVHADSRKSAQYQQMADWFEQHARHVTDLGTWLTATNGSRSSAPFFFSRAASQGKAGTISPGTDTVPALCCAYGTGTKRTTGSEPELHAVPMTVWVPEVRGAASTAAISMTASRLGTLVLQSAMTAYGFPSFGLVYAEMVCGSNPALTPQIPPTYA